MFSEDMLVYQLVSSSTANDFTDPMTTTAAEYNKDRKFALNDVYGTVTTNLQLRKEKMQAQYNKNIHLIDHKPGNKMWLKIKHYRNGEHRKLATRRRGPWTVVQKLPNGVNLKVVHNQSTIYNLQY